MTTLAGDIGGTKVHLALFTEGKRDWIVDEKFPSAKYGSLEEIIAAFLTRHKQKVERACFGVAGPVQNGHCHATNLPWVIEANKLAKVIGIKHVDLLNDLEANAYGIKQLTEEEFYVVNTGEPAAGNAALIAAGTGLGEACLYWDGKKHKPFACEGGHASFSPENDLEVELWRYLKKQYNHVSIERLLSGAGIVRIYRFLEESGYEKESPEVRASDYAAKEISRLGLEGKSAICKRTLDWFVSIYGSEAGNLSLKMLAVGGLYIGGGIAPKIAPFFRTGRFVDRMISKGRFAPLLAKIPVRLILNENTALLGAAHYVSRT